MMKVEEYTNGEFQLGSSCSNAKYTGEDIELTCTGPSEGGDNFDWLPDEFDAVYCGVENGLIVLSYENITLMMPYRKEAEYLTGGDKVKIRLR